MPADREPTEEERREFARALCRGLYDVWQTRRRRETDRAVAEGRACWLRDGQDGR